MQTTKQNWASHPTKMQALIVSIIWFLGTIAVIIDTTDNFQSDPFKKSNLFLLYACFIASVAYLKIGINYLKNNDEKSSLFKKVILKLIDTITDPLFITALGVLSSYLLRHGMRVMGKIVLSFLFMVIVLQINKLIDKKIEKRKNQI